MAARKRTSRSPKRSSARKSGNGSGSSAPMLALAAILGFGGFSLWATAHHKSPQTALNDLIRQVPSLSSTTSQPSRTESRPAAVGKAPETKAPSKDHAAAVGPIPRPSVPVAPSAKAEPKPVQQAALQAPNASRPSSQVSAPTLAGAPRAMPPRGVNTAAHSPSVVFAKTRLTIHKNAWDKAPAIGTVEKGREMRSYGKTGRWHRVIVPTTNMIGWVHEDQLIGGRDKPDSAKLITGSVAKQPQVAAKPAKPASSQPRVLPPKAVGEKN